jgi:hypothetical protein
MWTKIVQSYHSAKAFLQSGKVPPNTPIEYRDDLSKINFFSSKKFFIIFTSVILLMFFYLTSVGILFLTSFYPNITESYVVIFVESIKIFAIIISVYLGLQATIDFKYNGETKLEHNTSPANKSIEEIDKNVLLEETIKYQRIYKEDISYAPIEWVMNFEEVIND